LVTVPLISIFVFPLFSGLVLASPYAEVDEQNLEPDFVYSPYVGRAYPDQVLFGDTHFHTNLSFDAGLVGTYLGVDEAFRFARGETGYSNSGPEGRMEAFGNIIEYGTVKLENPFSSDDAARWVRDDFVRKVATYNQPGNFTAMTGIEWTSSP
jgi:hypothetical protein